MADVRARLVRLVILLGRFRQKTWVWLIGSQKGEGEMGGFRLSEGSDKWRDNCREATLYLVCWKRT